MAKNNIIKNKGTLLVALVFGLLFIPIFTTLATSVDRMSIVNLQGYPGKATKVEIKLEGTDPEERSGSWYAHYKKIDGDSDKMDITSWVTIEPKDYTIKKGETKVFTIEVKIPKNAEPGLWGATSEEAGKEGHASERRTYIVFKDAPGGGNVYSGLLIPVSVKVQPNPNLLAPVINFIEKNIITIVLSVIIIVLLARPLFRRKKQNYRRWSTRW